MIRARYDSNFTVNGSALRLNNLFGALRMLAVVSLFAMVVGPSVSGEAVGLSPVHSHLFMTDQAATGHNHDASDDSALESEVVSIGSHSADSAAGTVHLNDVTSLPAVVSQTTTSLTFGPDPEYSDPLITAPKPPPRLS